MSAEQEIKFLCDTLGVLGSGYYDWTNPKSVRETSDKTLLVEFKQIYAHSSATYGSPRIVRDLQDRGIRVGHNRVARLSREVGIVGSTKRRYLVHTTDSNHDQPLAPNLLRDIQQPERPNEVWVSDITCI